MKRNIIWNKKRVYVMCMQKIRDIKSRRLHKTIENAIGVADEILTEIKIKKVPVDISKMLTGLGFKIFVLDGLEDNVSGLIFVSPDLREKFNTDRIIILNAHDSPGRQRFTLAHEFSHYIFDFDEENEVTYIDTYNTDNDKEDSEIASSRFAAEILIPKSFFLEKYKELKKGDKTRYDIVLELTDYFNVSVHSIERRFEELKDDVSEIDLKK